MTLTMQNGREKERQDLMSATPGSLLLVSVLGSFGVATGSIALLEPDDRISIPRGAWLTILGLVFFVSLFDLLNHVALKTSMGQVFRKKYELTLVEVLEISNKTVSAVQALLSCVAGCVVCAWSCTRDFLKSSHFVSEAYAWFGAAYFFYDVWSMYRVHTVGSNSHTNRLTRLQDYFRQQPMILIHHLLIGTFGFLIITYFRGGLGDCVFGYVYLMEISTPFVSFRGILSKLKMKTSQLYVINGLAMVISFFFCRVFMFPYVCYLYSQLIGLPYWEAVWSLPRGCKIGISILMFPQVYWFCLMVKGALQVFLSKSNKSLAVETAS